MKKADGKSCHIKKQVKARQGQISVWNFNTEMCPCLAFFVIQKHSLKTEQKLTFSFPVTPYIPPKEQGGYLFLCGISIQKFVKAGQVYISVWNFNTEIYTCPAFNTIAV
ncbi:hypothetical protein KGO95_03060 [Patescibacteria group bacterium]|nr:hypothetical protein [Patescibacteria group bacterium]